MFCFKGIVFYNKTFEKSCTKAQLSQGVPWKPIAFVFVHVGSCLIMIIKMIDFQGTPWTQVPKW